MISVTIVGTGLLGRGIAAVVARAGNRVVLHDANPEVLKSALQQVSGTDIRSESDLSRAVADADVVVEAVAEDLALKQRIFEAMGTANETAVLMSNSSVLPIGQIASRTPNPYRAVGTHWWNPPHLIPIVEVIRGPQTSEQVMRQSIEFLESLGKSPVRVERDVPGFVGNRLQHALWREALALVSDSVCAPGTVDEVVKATLGPSLAERGPIAEIQRLGSERVRAEFAQWLPQINSDPRPAKLLRDNVAAGQLGAKTGRGFLDWPSGTRERVASNLQAHVERRLRGETVTHAIRSLNAHEQMCADRMKVAVWREALNMIETGVCDASTVDQVATQTFGLRLSVMAPVENADYVGLDLTLAIHEAVFPSLDRSLEMPSKLIRGIE